MTSRVRTSRSGVLPVRARVPSGESPAPSIRGTNRTLQGANRLPQLGSRANPPDGTRPPAKRANNSQRIGRRRIGRRRIDSQRVEPTRVVLRPRISLILGAIRTGSPPTGSRRRPPTARSKRVRSRTTHQPHPQHAPAATDPPSPTTPRIHPHPRPTQSRRPPRSLATSPPPPSPSTRGPTNHPPLQATYIHLARASPPSHPPRQSPSCTLGQALRTR